MIYTKFGSQLKLVSKHQGTAGKVSIQATAGDTEDIREYYVGDLKADGGLAEINEAVAKLPWKVMQGNKGRRGQHIRF